MVKTSLNTPLPHTKPKQASTPSPTPMDTSPPILSPKPLQMVEPAPPLPSITEIPPQKEESAQQTTSLTKPRTRKRKKEEEPSNEATVEKAHCKGTLRSFSINFDWCKESKFNELIEILEYQQWVQLFDYHARNTIIPKAMDEFVRNFECVDGTCKSEVNGTSIEFDSKYLATLLEVPDVGFCDYVKSRKDVNVCEGVGGYTVVEYVGGDYLVSTATKQEKFQTPLIKLLFNIVRRGIVPRKEKRTESCLLDSALIYCLANKVPINFPSLMIQHLDHCIPKYMVGYGSLLTEVFIDQGVELEGYEVMELGVQDYLQQSTLNKLHLKVVDGCVRHAKKERGSGSEDEEEEVEEAIATVLEKVKEKKKQKVGSSSPSVKPKRKSLRVANKVPKVIGPPTFVDITNEGSSEEVPEQQDSGDGNKQEKVPSPTEVPVAPKVPSPPTVPFGGPSTSSTSHGVPSGFGTLGFGGFGSTGTPSLEKKVQELLEVSQSILVGQEQLNVRTMQIQAQVGAIAHSVVQLELAIHEKKAPPSKEPLPKPTSSL